MATKKSLPQARVTLPGSEKATLTAATAEKAARPSGTLTVSVIVRRKKPLNVRRLGKDRLTRAQFSRQHSADPDAVKRVRAFAKEFGLAVEKGTPCARAAHREAQGARWRRCRRRST